LRTILSGEGAWPRLPVETHFKGKCGSINSKYHAELSRFVPNLGEDVLEKIKNKEGNHLTDTLKKGSF
jgi:hypothetical protein